MTFNLPGTLTAERNRALWMALVLLVSAGPLFFQMQLTHDAAWQMWVGRQLLHGADLYSDIIEINPPLWFWLAQPLSALSQTLCVDGLNVLVAFFLVSIAVSLFLTNRLLQGWPQWRRTLFLITFVVMALPPTNFGQREHFTFISATPYVLLIGCRRSAATVSPNLATLIGSFAAIGLALKPHFALIPIVLELWLRRSIIRPETVVLAVSGTIYAASVYLLEPDYFSKAVPMAQQAYSQFGNFDPRTLLSTALPLLVALMVRPGCNDVSRALLVASLTFYLVFVWQMKGFAYQVIPAMGMLALALAATASANLSVRNAIAFAAGLFAVTPNLAPYHTRAWADVPKRSSYGALSVAPRAGWPLVEERELRWPLRSISLWMAPALGETVRAGVTRDLQCNPPAYLLVDDRRINFSNMFRDVLSYYVAIEQKGRVTLMKLARAMPRPSGCRTIY